MNGRSYRELQADGQAEVERPLPELPSSLPLRTPAARANRRAQLAGAYDRLCERVVEDLLDTSATDPWHRMTAFASYSAAATLVDSTTSELFIACDRRVLSWLEERYRPALEAAATELAGRPMDVRLFDYDTWARLASRRDASTGTSQPTRTLPRQRRQENHG